MNSLSARFFSFLAAYAIVLQALFAGLMLPAQPGGVSELAVICSTSGSDQPANHDQAPCMLHCLLAAGCAAGDSAQPASNIAVLVAPAAIRISLPQIPQTLGRATAKNPQIPRAPPLA